MKKKIFGGIILCLLLAFGYKYYCYNYSNEGILENVINRNGYILNKINEPVSIKLFVKPEWIPYNSIKEVDLGEKLLELHSTDIILNNIKNTGNNIDFSFQTKYSLKFNSGTFIYNGILNENGTCTLITTYKNLILYDKNKKQIQLGQCGSNSKGFSFSIIPENYKYIEEGFYVEYSGFILYEYIKK
ncbi:hypothetical protein [Vallitalea guaymasensis]|uniref:Uncharacterized protein n=1 Tax=Vallitalea guaymasensis TaxID=1185412 RepID=A0A8J8MB25_9FIRM|nr:hypothetical protein [Vallitalea guaymasensis]QUH29616.1 hypothetical protein HYG85_12150 [Vallitalea guaymasensis]